MRARSPNKKAVELAKQTIEELYNCCMFTGNRRKRKMEMTDHLSLVIDGIIEDTLGGEHEDTG